MRCAEGLDSQEGQSECQREGGRWPGAWCLEKRAESHIDTFGVLTESSSRGGPLFCLVINRKEKHSASDAARCVHSTQNEAQVRSGLVSGEASQEGGVRQKISVETLFR